MNELYEELMVGNYLSFDGEIETINGQFIANLQDSYDRFEEAGIPDPKPIVMNEEWVKNFGFETNNVGTNLSYYKDGVEITVFKYPDREDIVDYDGKIIGFVHTFQNYHFCKTGVKLKIKEE